MTTALRDEKLDLTRLRRDAFQAGIKPALVTLEPAYYLKLDGTGGPNPPGGGFQSGVAALYPVAYGLKMLYKHRGMDFKVAPLEALWWPHGGWGTKLRDFTSVCEGWQWRLLLMVPDYVQPEDVAHVKKEQQAKRGEEAIGRVELDLVDEGLCVQVLHIGPYAQEAQAIKELRKFMHVAGLRACGPHHEVYFNAPDRTAPEKLRTLIRQPVSRIEDDCRDPANEW